MNAIRGRNAVSFNMFLAMTQSLFLREIFKLISKAANGKSIIADVPKIVCNNVVVILKSGGYGLVTNTPTPTVPTKQMKSRINPIFPPKPFISFLIVRNNNK